MWMLTLFKPWRKDVDELSQNGSFAEALANYMSYVMFPSQIYHEILRLKVCAFNGGQIDDRESEEFVGGENFLTPTAEDARTNEN